MKKLGASTSISLDSAVQRCTDQRKFREILEKPGAAKQGRDRNFQVEDLFIQNF